MHWNTVSALSFVLLLALHIPATANEKQAPFVRKGSIGTPQCAKDGFVYRPITCWEGEKFIFQPMPKSLRHYGYQSAFRGKSASLSAQDVPTYNEAVGRIGTVVEVRKLLIGWHVELQMDDNGQAYTALAFKDDANEASVDDLAPVLDLQAARGKWLGKTLWIKSSTLLTYDEAADKIGSIAVPKYSRVTVTDVVVGWFDTKNRFILRSESGAEGFIDVNLSGTNTRKIMRNYSKFEDLFFERDPREIYKWPDRVWDAIASEQVFVGMTEDQVKLSWGKPQEINQKILSGKTVYQWVYTKGYLFFENNILVANQN
jgi:hypothetical protein